MDVGRLAKFTQKSTKYISTNTLCPKDKEESDFIELFIMKILHTKFDQSVVRDMDQITSMYSDGDN